MSGLSATPELHIASRPHGLRLVLALGFAGAGAVSCAASPPPVGEAASSPARAVAPAAADITEIALERGCFGCAAGSLLVLRRDGTADHTVTGNARHGTADVRSRATIASADFEALAQQAVARGFYGWQDSYQDPQLADGAWTVLRLQRGDQARQVFERNQAGPAGLYDLTQAIESWQTRTAFEPSP